LARPAAGPIITVMFRRKQTAHEAAAPRAPATATPPSGPTAPAPAKPVKDAARPKEVAPKEIGGPPGPEPTRYGDWESKGRCIDF
jgi:hypothetical protein